MEQIIKISEDYFDYMAKRYPVMCLSDEFYFFPRAKKGAIFLNFLDSLDEQNIKQDISYIKNLKSSLEKLGYKTNNLGDRIDLAVLNQSMSTFLREFEEIKVWQMDPTLYLKIALLGVDHILTGFSNLLHDFGDNLMNRIAQITRLLDEAKNNLKKKEIPRGYLEVAIEMTCSSTDYFKSVSLPLKNRRTLSKEINGLIKKTVASLEDFKRFLKERSSHEVFVKDRELLERILKNSFSYRSSLEEIFEIATFEYHQTLKEMARIARGIKSTRSWQQILSAYRIKVKDTNGLLKLYSSQIEKIRNFLKNKDIITIPPTQNIVVRPTPKFLKPIRTSASYSSPLTDDMRGVAYFYITADFDKTNKPRTFNNIHNEYMFVTAHETYPGHHLLDSIRRRITNPIRQQIESPLFYEGWASYAERLIDQLGYVKNPLHRLVGLRRQAWRAVRAMLDVGVRIDKLKLEDAGELLIGLGYEPRAVKLMLRHYVLTPGYQSCYTIGKFEIDRLQKRFSSKIGLKKFHDLLLEGGEIPFDLAEERMEELLKGN